MGTWKDGYDYVKYAITETIDNNRPMFESVMQSLHANTRFMSEEEKVEIAATTVYRAVALALRVTPVGSQAWERPNRRDTFADELMRNMISSPGDDTSGMWNEIGQHYLNKIAEGN